MVLLDEPELHLNPRLVRALPEFYNKHLGQALDNQIWLITHSDALLREVVGHQGYSVFHMQTPTGITTEQSVPLVAKEGLQRAVIDLVGDLASYRPDAKLVIFEGENSEFDQRMTTALFPTFSEKVNIVSAGDKRRVRGLHDILAVALEKGQVPMKIFSIVDPDADEINPVASHRFVWDVYHIENYLLHPNYILNVVKDIGINLYATEEDVYVALRECARETLAGLVRHQLASAVHSELVKTVHTATDPHAEEVAPLLADAVLRSVENLSKRARELFSLEMLKENEIAFRSKYEQALAADSWRKQFRGREVLNRFAGRIGKIPYEVLRDLIIAKMRDGGYQPEGMRVVIERILAF